LPLLQNLGLPESSAYSTTNPNDGVVILPGNRINATTNKTRTRNPRYFAVIAHTIVVLIPVLPVVGNATAALEGMEIFDTIDAGVVEPVASKSCIPIAGDKGGLSRNCGARCRECWRLTACLVAVIEVVHIFGRGGGSIDRSKHQKW